MPREPVSYDINKMPISFLADLYWTSIGKEDFEGEYLEYIHEHFEGDRHNYLYLEYILGVHEKYSNAPDVLFDISSYYFYEFDYYNALIYIKKLKDLYPDNIYINDEFMITKESYESDIECNLTGEFEISPTLLKRTQDNIKRWRKKK